MNKFYPDNFKVANWKKEMSACKTLIKRYGFEVLKKYKNDFRVTSLTYLFAQPHKGNLETEKFNLEKIKKLKENSENYKDLTDREKVGEDTNTKPQIKSLADFINKYE